jgi:hypothetical protein
VSRSTPAWLVHRRPDVRFDWAFIAYWALTGVFIGLGLLALRAQLNRYVPEPANLFSDASLYLSATQTWVSGGNPWAVTSTGGIAFAAPPPALLLSVPLLPFGPDAARAFWAVADVVGWLIVIRRLGLGPWWLLFPPFLEALFPGNPDPALAGLVLVGGAWLTAFVKPYSVPAILADGRWRQVLVAAALGVGSLLVLPWAMFVAQLPAVRDALEAQAPDLNAWGNPVLMVLVVVALAVLGIRTALRLVVPTLWPSGQLHYSVFSARAGADSAALAVALAAPALTAQLVVVYAAFVLTRRVVGTRTFDRSAAAGPTVRVGPGVDSNDD